MIHVTDLDIVFLSYDEPLADQFFADLRSKCPKATHVEGVKGLDAAYKATAEAASTEFLITIDGDNIVDPAFFHLHLDPRLMQSSTVLGWPGRNVVNGLQYGNGSIKCWSRDHLLGLSPRSHSGAVDFVYNNDLRHPELAYHIDMGVPFSTAHFNATPQQAFRSAFREGVRLSAPDLDEECRRRLAVWMSVGKDARHGDWAIYGARLGCERATSSAFDRQAINDYDWFDDYWRTEIAPQFSGSTSRCALTGFVWDQDKLDSAVDALGSTLRRQFGFDLVELDKAQSRVFKALRQSALANQVDRLGLMWRDGLGVTPNAQRAAAYFEAGRLLGTSNAMVNLARATRQGELGRIDYRQSAELLLEARGLGNQYAETRISDLGEAGFGWGIDRHPNADSEI
ncbi:MAG: hypothetical protein AAFY56_02025 [Pseudomonadota bacterium]